MVGYGGRGRRSGAAAVASVVLFVVHQSVDGLATIRDEEKLQQELGRTFGPLASSDMFIDLKIVCVCLNKRQKLCYCVIGSQCFRHDSTDEQV